MTSASTVDEVTAQLQAQRFGHPEDAASNRCRLHNHRPIPFKRTGRNRLALFAERSFAAGRRAVRAFQSIRIANDTPLVALLPPPPASSPRVPRYVQQRDTISPVRSPVRPA